MWKAWDYTFCVLGWRVRGLGRMVDWMSVSEVEYNLEVEWHDDDEYAVLFDKV